MEVSISSLFAEPGYSLDISYRVNEYFGKLLNEKIHGLKNLTIGDEETFLSLIVTTGSKTLVPEAKGPDFDKKNNCVTWGIWLPYKKVVKSKNAILEYSNSFFDALVNFFEFYDLSREELKTVKELAQKEIKNNLHEMIAEDEEDDIDLSEIEI